MGHRGFFFTGDQSIEYGPEDSDGSHDGDEYDGHDADECYACDGTGWIPDGRGSWNCECPCHKPQRDPVGRRREAAAQEALGDE